MTDATEGKKKRPEGYQQTNTSGIAGDTSYEEQGYYYELRNEKVIQGENDCRIVLGRDRPSGPGSGYGGIGYTRASAIDIVAGSVTNKWSKENIDTQQSGVWLNPDFIDDAARIHISQKTDVDDNFGLPEGRLGKGNTGNSAIGIKADNVRLIARESVKLIASAASTDSTGLSCAGAGVELIAMQEDVDAEISPPAMQPIPKGYNLQYAFEEVAWLLEEVTALMGTFAYLQSEMNQYFACHAHFETFNGNQGIKSLDLPSPLFANNLQMLQDIQMKIKEFKEVHINKFKNDYISSTSNSPTYINSKYHYLN